MKINKKLKIKKLENFFFGKKARFHVNNSLIKVCAKNIIKIRHTSTDFLSDKRENKS
jgi:hypothetical protein